MKKILLLFVCAGLDCFAQSNITLTVTGAQINSSVLSVVAGASDWNANTNRTTVLEARATTLEGLTNGILSVSNRVEVLEGLTNGILSVSNRVTTLESYTNRITALEPYTNRTIVLESYTNRIIAIENKEPGRISISNRVVVLEGRVAGETSVSNRVVALETHSFTPSIYEGGQYTIFPNGMMIQGETRPSTAVNANNGVVVTFSPPFHTIPFVIPALIGANDTAEMYANYRSLTTNGFRLVNSGAAASTGYSWIAIGY